MSRGAAIKGSRSLRPQQFEMLQYFVWTGPNNYHYFIVFMLITNDYYPICPPFLAVQYAPPFLATHHPLVVSNPIDKKGSEFMRRRMRWEAPPMPTSAHDPGLLREQETPIVIGKNWFVDQEIPTGGFIRIQDSSQVWEEQVSRAKWRMLKKCSLEIRFAKRPDARLPYPTLTGGHQVCITRKGDPALRLLTNRGQENHLFASSVSPTEAHLNLQQDR